MAEAKAAPHLIVKGGVHCFIRRVLRHKFDDFGGPLAVSNTVVEPSTAGRGVVIRF